MSSALLPVPAFLAPLQSLWRWLMPGVTSDLLGRSAALRQQPHPHELAAYSIANHLHGAGGKRPSSGRALVHRPLRIVHVMEAGQAPAQMGRMLISGRMADVCAELDRLAARETTLH